MPTGPRGSWGAWSLASRNDQLVDFPLDPHRQLSVRERLQLEAEAALRKSLERVASLSLNWNPQYPNQTKPNRIEGYKMIQKNGLPSRMAISRYI